MDQTVHIRQLQLRGAAGSLCEKIGVVDERDVKLYNEKKSEIS